MGTDIHLRVERRTARDAAWEVVKPGPQPSPYEEGRFREDWPTPRNYYFFALAANVRNGYGFAGVPTHAPVVPIAEPRGLPLDMASAADADDEFGESYEEADAAGVSNLGDHSFTWLLLSELQAGVRSALAVHETGWVSLVELAEMQSPAERPKSWSGGIDGVGVVKIPFELAWIMSRSPEILAAAERSKLLFVARHDWTVPPDRCIASAYLRLIFEEWPKFGEPDNVRVIMGFDS